MIGNSVHVALATPADKPMIERLLKPYLIELSRYRVGETAQSEAYRYLDLYWQEPQRQPFLIRKGNAVPGFALVNAWSPSRRPIDQAIAEFFIAQEFRRTGIGSAAALKILAGKAGWWEIGIQKSHDPARRFWSYVVAHVPNAVPEWLTGDGQRWSGPILRFESA
jgi:predicted acetyltransferase